MCDKCKHRLLHGCIKFKILKAEKIIRFENFSGQSENPDSLKNL